MKLYQMAIAALMALSATTTLAAPPAADPRGDALAAETRLGRFASETKGGPQQRLLLAKQKIRRLIEDLDAGAVRLCGTFSGARIDLREVDRPWVPAAETERRGSGSRGRERLRR